MYVLSLRCSGVFVYFTALSLSSKLTGYVPAGLHRFTQFRGVAISRSSVSRFCLTLLQDCPLTNYLIHRFSYGVTSCVGSLFSILDLIHSRRCIIVWVPQIHYCNEIERTVFWAGPEQSESFRASRCSNGAKARRPQRLSGGY